MSPRRSTTGSADDARTRGWSLRHTSAASQGEGQTDQPSSAEEAGQQKRMFGLLTGDEREGKARAIASKLGRGDTIRAKKPESARWKKEPGATWKPSLARW